MKTHDGRKPSAVTDKQTYQLLSRTGKVGRGAILAGMRLILSRVAEVQHSSGIEILCPQFKPERPLELLRARVADYGVSIQIPEIEDERCVVVPSSLAELSRLLDRYETVIVLGTDGIIATVDPAGKPAVELVRASGVCTAATLGERSPHQSKRSAAFS